MLVETQVAPAPVPPLETEPLEPPAEKEPLEPPAEKEPLEPPAEKEPPEPLEPPEPEQYAYEDAQLASSQQTPEAQ